jgi:type II secretory ATPase GspE/PulE/Tfp pilus assembly ATPase PilB-like protein
LVTAGVLSAARRDAALEEQAGSGDLLGQILVDAGHVDRSTLARYLWRQYGAQPSTAAVLARIGLPSHHIDVAMRRQQQFHETLHDIMGDWGLLTPEAVARAIAIEHQLRYLPGSRIDQIDASALQRRSLVPDTWTGHVPIALEAGAPRDRLTIAIADLREIAPATRLYRDYDCQFVVASPATCQTIHRRHFARTEQTVDRLLSACLEVVGSAGNLSTVAAGGGITAYRREEPPAPALLMALLRHACYLGASDLSLHRSPAMALIRLKVDGVWQLFRAIPEGLCDALFGVMRNTLLRGIQDERLNAGFTDCAIDLQSGQDAHSRQLRQQNPDIADRHIFRVALGNAIHGRTMTIRINDRHAIATDIEQLGFDGATLHCLRAVLRARSGVVLVCGPTGSGKTTTLHALLQSADPVRESIQTVESPVEYTHGLWQQFALDPHGGASEGRQWALALKGLLRNAPDKILFGEVRDDETARELFRAANTGHLVLSTLHANGAVETLRRLADLGVGTDQVAAGLRGVLAQRLVRKLCRQCRLPDERDSTWHRLLARRGAAGAGDAGVGIAMDVGVFRASARGCESCRQTGYRGRRMIHEWLEMSSKLRDQLETRAPLSALRTGILGGSLRENGLALVAAGVTSIDELTTQIALED